jgi:uncharacterized protein (DUF779 family)
MRFSIICLAARANILNKIADRMEQNLELLAYVETVDNGKPIRETTLADVPLAIDHMRYFAACIRAQEGSLAEIDETTVAYHFHEPLGVVGQIIPWNFPLLMAVWKLAPALAAGNCVVLKPAEQTPISIMVLAELIADLLPPGVLNIVNGFGLEAGKPLASSNRIAKIAFTGETTTGRLIMQYASHNLIPVTLELGGKSPNIFFEDVMNEDDAFLDKAIEGLVLFALNQGEVCTCPSRAFIQESIFDHFMERVLKRVAAIKQGNPLEMSTIISRPRICWSATAPTRSAFSEMVPARVLATEAALALIARLEAQHGSLMFHQSGGCCDGSSPMCFAQGDYMLSPADVELGEIGGAKFYMSASQFAYWRFTQLIIDVVPGMGGMFSLENGSGSRFLTRSRVFNEAELAALAARPGAAG